MVLSETRESGDGHDRADGCRGEQEAQDDSRCQTGDPGFKPASQLLKQREDLVRNERPDKRRKHIVDDLIHAVWSSPGWQGFKFRQHQGLRGGQLV